MIRLLSERVSILKIKTTLRLKIEVLLSGNIGSLFICLKKSTESLTTIVRWLLLSVSQSTEHIQSSPTSWRVSSLNRPLSTDSPLPTSVSPSDQRWARWEHKREFYYTMETRWSWNIVWLMIHENISLSKCSYKIWFYYIIPPGPD